MVIKNHFSAFIWVRSLLLQIYDVHYQLLPNRDVEHQYFFMIIEFAQIIDFKNKHEICAGKKRIGQIYFHIIV